MKLKNFKNSSISEISSQEFKKTIEKSSKMNENNSNNKANNNKEVYNVDINRSKRKIGKIF
jgi:hypothetical protein